MLPTKEIMGCIIALPSFAHEHFDAYLDRRSRAQRRREPPPTSTGGVVRSLSWRQLPFAPCATDGTRGGAVLGDAARANRTSAPRWPMGQVAGCSRPEPRRWCPKDAGSVIEQRAGWETIWHRLALSLSQPRSSAGCRLTHLPPSRMGRAPGRGWSRGSGPLGRRQKPRSSQAWRQRRRACPRRRWERTRPPATSR